MIFLRFPFHSNLKVLDYGGSPIQADRIKEDITLLLGCSQFSLLHNDKKLCNADVLPSNSTVHVTFSLPGGKGGFGSMLRAIGAQIEKTTNREACRDLSGRRLRDINEEQRLKKWISKEAEREAEKIKRRKARIERLKTKAPHKFFDYDYEKEISELPGRVNDALSEGLQKAKQHKKRPLEKSEATDLPKSSWMSEDFSVSSSDSDSEETNVAGEGSSKKQKMTPKDSSSCDSDISEFSQSHPSSSKDSSFTPEESMSCDSKSDLGDIDSNTRFGIDLVTCKENDQTSEKKVLQVLEAVENNVDGSSGKVTKTVEVSGKESDVLESGVCAPTKAPEAKDDSPIDLLDYQSISELENLGLDRLKSALIARGLKCGGNLSDRAQRLWKVRDLQPHEYPASLLAKRKK